MCQYANSKHRYLKGSLPSTLEKLKGATIFSKTDLTWGYHQIVLLSDSCNITAFQDNRGLYCFKLLLFGITLAPEQYNHVITNLFSLCPGVASIFDDIIVFGKDKSEHDKNLDLFFKTLIQNGLTANPKKCIFRLHTSSGNVVRSLLGSKYPKTEYIQWKAKLLQFKHLNHQIIS